MVTRREMIAATAGAAFAGGVWTNAVASALGDAASSAATNGVGPLLPSPAAALKRFLGLRYGAFIHWGPATVLGKEISWTREVETPSTEYDVLYKRFNPVEFDADVWVKMLKDSGFRYLTFVTKHHEGFAMWDTKTTNYNIMNTPFRRDVLKEISAACKKHDLALCLYYSIADFYQPDCIGASSANGMYLGPPGYTLPEGRQPNFDRYVEYMKAQLKELTQNYGPVLAWWFDGGWMSDWTYERGVDLLKYIRSLQADTLADQRVGGAYNGRVYMPTWFPTDRKYVGDFAVLEVDTPRFNRTIPWEYTTPANGRSYCWTPGPYGDPHTWIDNFIKSACGDGNYLLGLTPPTSGRFDPALVDKLAESSVWVKRYGASVFETRGGPYMRTNIYGSTCKGNLVYLHVFDPKVTTLTLPPLPRKIVGCSMLNGGKATVAQDAKSVTVSINPNDVASPSTIVVLKLDGSAEQIAPISEPSLTRAATVRSSNKDPSGDHMIADGDMQTFWKSDGHTKQPWIEFDLGTEKTVSRATLFEGEYEGELANIHRYQIEVKLGDEWKPVEGASACWPECQPGREWKRVADISTWGTDTGQEEDFSDWPISVFHPEIRFTPVRARRVRLKILKSVAPAVIHEFELYER